MPRTMNWLFGSLSKAQLNAMIDITAIGGVPSNPVGGTSNITGNLTVSGTIDGIPVGAYACTTAGSVQDKVVGANIVGSQDCIIVYFEYANTYNGGATRIVDANGITYTLYINNTISSATNYNITKGLHFLSFRTTIGGDRIAYLDFLIPNDPASYPTSLNWVPTLNSSNVQTGLTLKMQGFNMPDVTSLTMPVASATDFGILSISAQTIAGNKTFSGVTTFSDATDANGTTGAVVVAGGITCAKNIYCLSVVATSSRDAKTNIKPFTRNASKILNTVKVVSFNYKNDPEHLKVGFISEDTDELLSSETKKKFDIGNSIGLLIKSFQELSARVTELEDGNAK